MSELFGTGRKEVLKDLIKRLHQGANPEDIKKEFKDIIKDATPVEVAKIEEELVKEGMSREEIQKLCDVHLAVFREGLEKEKVLAPPGHPVHILLEEHKIILEFTGRLKELVQKIKSGGAGTEEMEHISHIIKHLKDSESHYIREENVLFPYLEKHGITEPPAIMWMEHDKIREVKKNIYGIVDAGGLSNLEAASAALNEMLSSHFYKENNILFPTAMSVIPEDEWGEIRKQFDEIGYCCFTPEVKVSVKAAPEARPSQPPAPMGGVIDLETGRLSREEIESIFNTLPVDITFVDKDDTVRYFSAGKERIFPRTKAIIGRKVQQCHPQKSVHVVNQILEDFKNGKMDVAEFWINLKGRLIYIRYFPVRDRNGRYLGCLEASQDITEIQKIKGEKRLLDVQGATGEYSRYGGASDK